MCVQTFDCYCMYATYRYIHKNDLLQITQFTKVTFFHSSLLVYSHVVCFEAPRLLVLKGEVNAEVPLLHFFYFSTLPVA